MAETPEHVPRALCPLAPAAEGGGASAAGLRQRLLMTMRRPQGWGQEERREAFGEGGRPSGLKAETALESGEGRKGGPHDGA